MRIEPIKGWHRYTEFMNAETDPRRRAMLDNMRHHLKYECLCDPEIFDTMVPSPEYRFYGSFGNAVLKGMDEVKGFYQGDMWASQASLVELHIHRCAPADWGVACDGEWYQQIPGANLAADGADVDPERWYLSHAHLSWFFPFEEIDGRMLLVGEICYIDDPGSTIEPLDPGDVLTLEEAREAWRAL
tara:strand:- start:2731 stop:3291 length:561 start_codon:yes stop_codon:yes gene_type:complete